MVRSLLSLPYCHLGVGCLCFLLSKAGRLAEFDALASKFFVASGEARDSIYQEAVGLATSVGDASKPYIRYMEKVVSGTEAYLEKEAKRCVVNLLISFPVHPYFRMSHPEAS